MRASKLFWPYFRRFTKLMCFQDLVFIAIFKLCAVLGVTEMQLVRERASDGVSHPTLPPPPADDARPPVTHSDNVSPHLTKRMSKGS